MNARVVRQFNWLDHIQVVELPVGASVPEWIRFYLDGGLVEFAEPDHLLVPAAVPDDPYYSSGALWHLHNSGQNGGTPDADIDAPEGWDTLSSASNIVVAVIDTGIRYTHEDLAANTWVNPGEIAGNGLDDDANGYVDDVHGINAPANSGDPIDLIGHGTQIAGLLGAVGNNGVGVTGVSWRVSIMACRFFDDDGVGSVADAVECFDYARNQGAHIVNASFGAPDFSSTLYTAINQCRFAGIIVVAAAGNDGKDREISPFYPSSFDLDNIVSVAATTRTDGLASYSGYGALSVDLGAPGTDLYTTYHNSNSSYVSNSGSSFSTPVVAGALALLKARYPAHSYGELIQRLLNTVDSLPSLSGKCVTGGRLNLASALGPSLFADYVADPIAGAPPLSVSFVDRSYGAISSWAWDFGDGTASTAQHPSHLYSAEGTFIATLTIGNDLGQTSSHSSTIAVVANYQIDNTAYEWIDPAAMTALPLSHDGVSPAQALPFTFTFYGLDYTQLYVSANGLIGFTNENLTVSSNTDLPEASAPNNIICPFWDDLNPGAGGNVLIGIIGSAPERKVIISWVDVPHAASPPANYTFQAVLEESTHRIRFQYQSVNPGRGPGDQGKSATVAIENAAGTLAARYSYNGSTLLTNGTSVVFTPSTPAPTAGVLNVTPTAGWSSSGTVGGPFSPASVLYSLANTGGSSLDWTTSKAENWLSVSPAGGTLAAGTSTTLTVSINGYADALAGGSYSDTVFLASDTTPDDPYQLEVALLVGIRPVLTLYSVNDAGTFQMVIEALAGTEIVVEASADVLSWSAVATNKVIDDGTMTFSDLSITGARQRFYRARTNR